MKNNVQIHRSFVAISSATTATAITYADQTWDIPISAVPFAAIILTLLIHELCTRGYLFYLKYKLHQLKEQYESVDENTVHSYKDKIYLKNKIRSAMTDFETMRISTIISGTEAITSKVANTSNEDDP